MVLSVDLSRGVDYGLLPSKPNPALSFYLYRFRIQFCIRNATQRLSIHVQRRRIKNRKGIFLQL
ncbi:hypothetical protein NC653_032849 [Populus alba x Populus x berolinensis]|uniref:Uncharacterized protein n=1 Tax=Populus alba x Populus x berolinensis TaxID=444605 RepID=A0AAD6LV68_9ROSI|nr:hypothetical protein NC653_032849 [Populus alba x Populus x berolinensis]